MLQIVKFPDPILRERMPDFDFENPVMDPKELEREMLATMFANKGIGLAANQVGIRARVFTLGDKTNFLMAKAYFNPKIIANTSDVLDLEEGCLSFPGIFINIKRPSAIKVEYQNSDGETETAEFEGYDCKVFLHEHDHLEGIVFQDRVSPLKWALAVKKSKPNKRKGI
jgi:peptide deformylase